MPRQLTWKLIDLAVRTEQARQAMPWIPAIYRPRQNNMYARLEGMNQTVTMLRQALPHQYDEIERNMGVTIDRSFDPFNPIGLDEHGGYQPRFLRLIDAVQAAKNEDRFR